MSCINMLHDKVSPFTCTMYRRQVLLGLYYKKRD